MVSKFSNKIIRKYLILKRKIVLIVLNKLFDEYQKETILLKKINRVESQWDSVLTNEEKIIRQCQQILVRRIQQK